MIDHHFMTGITLILKYSFSFKNWLMEMVMLMRTVSLLINNSHSLIKHLMIKSAGKIVYDTDNLITLHLSKTYWNTVMIIADLLQKIVYGI